MAISFDSIPVDLRSPLFYAEVDGRRAGTYAQNLRSLIIGGTLKAAQDKKLQVCSSADQAKALFGWGSMLSRQVAAFRRNNPTGELWVLPLADSTAEGVTPFSRAITFSGTTTAAGTVWLYIGGQVVPVPIAKDKDATAAATAVRAFINRQKASVDLLHDLPVNVTADGAVVTFTAKHAGPAGEVDIRLNYGGTQAGEYLPPGLTATLGAPTIGSGDPSVVDALAMIGDEPMEYYISGYNDNASIEALEAFIEARYDPMRQLYGMAVFAKDATYANLLTAGDARNSKVSSILGIYDSPTWTAEIAAAYGGVVSRHLSDDPARTLQTLVLDGVRPPAVSRRFDIAERNSLLYGGIATTYAAGGDVRIDRAISCYQVNSYGVADDSWLDLTTVATAARFVREVKTLVTNRFPRMKLAADGSPFGHGQAIVTPKTIRATLIGHYMHLCKIGICQKPEAFERTLHVEIDPQNHSRINVLAVPNFINSLIVFAERVEFVLR